jgi:hypothetical protein
MSSLGATFFIFDWGARRGNPTFTLRKTVNSTITMKTKEKKSSFISVALRDLPKFFSEKFKKDKMIQLENRLLFSSFWKDYA